MKKHKLLNVLAIITITLFILSFVALMNIFVLFLYDIKTPMVITSIIVSILAASILLIPIVFIDMED